MKIFKNHIMTRDLLKKECINFVYNIKDIDGVVYLIKNKKMVNAKSIIGVLSLNIKKNDMINIMTYNNSDIDKVIKFLNGR